MRRSGLGESVISSVPGPSRTVIVSPYSTMCASGSARRSVRRNSLALDRHLLLDGKTLGHGRGWSLVVRRGLVPVPPAQPPATGGQIASVSFSLSAWEPRSLGST